MSFENWDENARYSNYTAAGWMPAGTSVQFKCDGTLGIVVNGNAHRSLVEFHPPVGGGWQREWFNNSDLRIAA